MGRKFITHISVSYTHLRYVVPDFRLNKAFAQWDTLTGWQRDKVEFLCNDCLLYTSFFHKIHIDPAVASGPLITTVNDLVAVVTYYGLAWFFLIEMLHY